MFIHFWANINLSLILNYLIKIFARAKIFAEYQGDRYEW